MKKGPFRILPIKLRGGVGDICMAPSAPRSCLLKMIVIGNINLEQDSNSKDETGNVFPKCLACGEFGPCSFGRTSYSTKTWHIPEESRFKNH
jgi:hypothetical protein